MALVSNTFGDANRNVKRHRDGRRVEFGMGPALVRSATELDVLAVSLGSTLRWRLRHRGNAAFIVGALPVAVMAPELARPECQLLFRSGTDLAINSEATSGGPTRRAALDQKTFDVTLTALGGGRVRLTVTVQGGATTSCEGTADAGPYALAASGFNSTSLQVLPLSGPSSELPVEVGAFVQRGPTWKWGGQDGGAGGVGRVTGLESSGWLRVRWASGRSNCYRHRPDDDVRDLVAVPASQWPAGLAVPEVGGGDGDSAAGSTDDGSASPPVGGEEEEAELTRLLHAVSQLSEGQRVRVRPSVSEPSAGWGSVSHRSRGTLKSIGMDGRVIIDFQEQAGWVGTALEVEPVEEEDGVTAAAGPLSVGDRVRVRPSVERPSAGWGSVTHASVGTLVKVEGDGVRVDFPEQRNWRGKVEEMERVATAAAGGRPVLAARNTPGAAAPYRQEPELRKGDFVVRGPAWRWSDQDGGAGNVGVVVDPAASSDGWARVTWANGRTNNYRFRPQRDEFDVVHASSVSDVTRAALEGHV